MKTVSVIPKNEAEWLSLRSQNLNSTEISALFGLSPYATKFELWHRVKGNVSSDFEANQRTVWGTRLQDSIALGIAKDNGWDVRKMEEYISEPQLKMGSSFDFSIEKHPDHEGPGILEIKNVDGLQFKNTWLKDDNGDLEAPTHIELQIQHQLLVSGRKYGFIGALVGGNDLKIISRVADESIQFQIIEAVRDFWQSIEDNNPPAPDFAADAETIAKLYSYSTPGSVINGTSEIQSLVEQYKVCAAQAKEYETQKQAIKAQLLMIIGDAEKVKGEGYSISAGMIGPQNYEVNKKGYRDFRCFIKKEG